MNDLGELHYFLGMEFERNKEACTITMNKWSYIKEVLKCFNMEECKLVGISFDENLKLFKSLHEEFGNMQRKMEGTSYKAGVRYLMYAIVGMRADLTIVVSLVSQLC